MCCASRFAKEMASTGVVDAINLTAVVLSTRTS